jgi:hypothetical protein
VEGTEGANSSGGTPDTFLPPGAPTCFRLRAKAERRANTGLRLLHARRTGASASGYPPTLSVKAVASSSLPASENLHRTGLTQCSNRHCYSMTSSASESRLSEMAMPCAFAAFKLIISSNLSTCCTGRSVGLAPLRILTV